MKTLSPLLGLALGAAGIIATLLPAHAQQGQCAARSAVLATLMQQFGETRRGMGLAGQSAVVELFASAETGTWTVTATLADGTTCLVASGQGWEPVTEELPASGTAL